MRLLPLRAAIAAAAALTLLVVVLAGGCTSDRSTKTVPAAVKAPPQTARLTWSEPYPADAPALVFGVTSFTVTATGWRAAVSVENLSDVGWSIGDPRFPTGLVFGVMLFPDDDLDELEQRSRNGTLPAVRPATRFEPPLPEVLQAGTSWRGTISAPGALAGGLWVRISFGPFVSLGDPPPGAEAQVGWITDHAYRLEQVEGKPA